jgi:hypothetical protein
MPNPFPLWKPDSAEYCQMGKYLRTNVEIVVIAMVIMGLCFLLA